MFDGLTNSLRVSFKKASPVSVSEAFEELATHGEILRLELLPGEPGIVVVSFYDVRAAREAANILGPWRCSMEPQWGQRSVACPGEVQIPRDDLAQVSSVFRDEGSEMYTLEFFDVRVAEQFAEQHGLMAQISKKSQKAYLAPSHEPLPSAPQAPRYRNDLRISEVRWADLQNGREWRTTLRISCLPVKLCNEQAFARLLSEAGLSQHVDIFRVFANEKRPLGIALVNAKTTTGVAQVAKYFHARSWGKSIPVAVSFAATQGFSEVISKFPSKERLDITQLKDSKLKALPQHVEVRETMSTGFSEVSTEVGDEAETIFSDIRSGASPIIPPPGL
mmetsp:Transcript_93624/g.166589  ORF Transcript_93624/g.166589 Transcript_93624/m.166589 type:complete len:334 (+) Transcript_93624:109-1110(+)